MDKVDRTKMENGKLPTRGPLGDVLVVSTESYNLMVAERDAALVERDDYKLRWEQSEACSVVINQLRRQLETVSLARAAYREWMDSWVPNELEIIDAALSATGET